MDRASPAGRGSLYPRVVERLLGEHLLPALPAIHLVGPRGCGKTTSAVRLADSVLDLSEPGIRRAARESPDSLLAASPGTVLVDEWQEAPEILGAVKRAVDRDLGATPGRFIVAGSVRAAQQAATWPGTGRLVRVRMYGLTCSEMEGRDGYNPVDGFFEGASSGFRRSELGRSDYADAVARGRLPAVARLDGGPRSRWFASYVEQLAERDAAQVWQRAARPSKLRAVLESCAARTGQVLNRQAAARDAGVDVRTADAHISLLEDLSVVVRVPAWHSNRVKRLTRSPKIHVVDPGMAAHLLNVDAQSLALSATLVGQLFETFVATEVLPHLETATTQTRLFHARGGDGKEVDLVLERHGAVVGLEVKSSQSVSRADARGLLWLRDALGDAFRFGAVLYAGAWPFDLDDRIWALPISTLWRPPDV